MRQGKVMADNEEDFDSDGPILTAEERQRQRDADVPFRQVDVSEPGLYLGDVQTVQAILRAKIGSVCDELAQTTDSKKQERIIHRAGRAMASVFLGENPLCKHVPGWNEPGLIDESLAEWLSIAEEDPDERIAHAFVMLLMEMMNVGDIAEKTGMPDGQWQPAAAAVMGRYAAMFAGQAPASQDAMLFGNSEPLEYKEEE